MKQDQYSFSTKWSSRIGSGGYTTIPNLLLRHQSELGITNGELAVLCNLLLYMWDSSMPYPSASTIAKHSGMATHTVRTHLRALEDKSIVKRKFRKAQTNMYDLKPLKFKLEKLATQHLKMIPVQKLTPLYSNPPTPPYSDLNTNKEAEKKTQRKRRNNELGITPIKSILDKKMSHKLRGQGMKISNDLGK